ncbi:MAG TPA: hypothetical protein VLV15_13735, partial [Dongiaceae bacterium]|nr:hypothetical protein [Dongiaceae bacterium]
TGAAILFGGTFTYWWSAIGAEVYNLAVVMFLFALWRVTVALETRSARDGILAALLLGLTATGHLAFGPALLVLGVTLVMHAPEGAPPAGFAIVLLGAFTLGLTPYLYVLVADHSGLPMNYLRSILEPAGHQFGIDPRTFSNPWVRLGYMFTGREATNLYTLHPRELLANAADALAIEGLFELGPIAAALALFGAVRLARRRDAIAFALLGAGAATLIFATVSAWARLRPVFLMPCTVVLSIAVGFGLDGTAARARGPGWARAAGIAALVGVAALAPHLLRLRAIARPIGPLGWHMRVKDGPMPAGPLPSFAGDWSARRYGEAVLRGIPPGALVVGRWYEITVLEYLLLAEGQRPDLTLEPYDGSHRVRLERWQDRHDLKRRPFVLLTRLPGLAAAFADADSIVVAPGQTLLVKRTRITAPTY